MVLAAPKTRRAPVGGFRPKPIAPSGALRRTHPPSVDLRALAFVSTCSHRPSRRPRAAWRAMPLFGVPGRSPGALSVATVHADPVSRVIEIGADQETFSSEPVGVAPIRPSPSGPILPRGHPWIRSAPAVSVSCVPTPLRRHPLPDVACAVRNENHLERYKTPGQEVLSKSQGCPQNFLAFPQTRGFHPLFIHRPTATSHHLTTESSTSCRGVIRCRLERAWPRR
jgi:hypothetical protein